MSISALLSRCRSRTPFGHVAAFDLLFQGGPHLHMLCPLIPLVSAGTRWPGRIGARGISRVTAGGKIGMLFGDVAGYKITSDDC